MCPIPKQSIPLTLGDAAVIVSFDMSVQNQFGLPSNLPAHSFTWISQMTFTLPKIDQSLSFHANHTACEVLSLLNETNSISQQIQSCDEGLRSAFPGLGNSLGDSSLASQ